MVGEPKGDCREERHHAAKKFARGLNLAKTTTFIARDSATLAKDFTLGLNLAKTMTFVAIRLRQ